MDAPHLLLPRVSASSGGPGFFFYALFGMLGLCYVLLAIIFLGPQGATIATVDKVIGFVIVSALAAAAGGLYLYVSRGEHVRLTPESISLLRGRKVTRTFAWDAIHFIAVITTEPRGPNVVERRLVSLGDATRRNDQVSLGTTMLFVSNAPAKDGDVIAFVNSSWRRPADREDLILFHPHKEAVEWIATYFPEKLVG